MTKVQTEFADVASGFGWRLTHRRLIAPTDSDFVIRHSSFVIFPRMLRSLAIRHFRCFEKFGAEFAPGLNLIVGPNAHGKTSLLEAACVLLRLQSPRASPLTEVVQH